MPTFRVAFNWSRNGKRERRVVTVTASNAYAARQAYVDHIDQSELIGKSIGSGDNIVTVEMGEVLKSETACQWCNVPIDPTSYNAQYCTDHKRGPHTPGMIRP